MDIAGLLAEANLAQQHAMYELYHGIMLYHDIDEISLLFGSEQELEQFLALAEPHVDHFNSVPRDRMWRDDGEEEQWFDVRFEFLRIPTYMWRIEAMCVLDGSAPLHAQKLRDRGRGCVVHASYKLPDEATYYAHKSIVKDVSGRTADAEYHNSYGRFSYWNVLGGRFYLKPRVNLRDQ